MPGRRGNLQHPFSERGFAGPSIQLPSKQRYRGHQLFHWLLFARALGIADSANRADL